MKFTEGYWLRSERANPLFASQAYFVDEIPNGIRVMATPRPINSREETLNLGTITTEFTAAAENIIAVRSYHYEGYDDGNIAFEKNLDHQDVKVTITEDEALMVAGNVAVRIDRTNWNYQFEADGEVITTCGFRNLGYMQWDRKTSTHLPEDNYMLAEYEPYM